MQDRIPAQNIEAEQAVLSAILIDNSVMNKVTEILKSPDFYRIVHQIIYQTMVDMHAKHQPIDLITLIEELKNRNKLDDVGGVSYITLLANIVPTSANALYHARIVVNNALLRQLGESGAAITALSFEKEEDIQSLIDRAEQTLHSVSLRKHGKAFVPIHDILTHTMDRMTSLQTNGESVTGLSTGFADLDRLTTGLHPSDFIILAARPSMGKTALALNIAQNVALRGAKEKEAPKRVAFFSLEMSSDQLVQRMLCTEADTDIKTLAAGSGTGDHSDCPQAGNREHPINQSSRDSNSADNSLAQWNRLWEAAAKLDEAHIFIDDTPGLSILDLRSRARRLQAEGGLDFIVIDYLQLMQGSRSRKANDNRQQEVTEISRGLKALARELQVPVLALSQLSRSVELRQSKQPMLSDLRESGSLEQDADIVMFLYREDYYKGADDAPSHITELIVAKHRNGPTGRVTLFFKEDCTKFISLTRRKKEFD